MAMSADWYPDPSGRHQVRYWDGSSWTDHIANAGVAGAEPLAEDAPPPSPVSPAPQPANPSSGGGWMDRVKSVAQDVAEQGKAVIDEVSAPPKSTAPTQQGPAPANGAQSSPAPSGSQSPPPSASPPPSSSPPPVAAQSHSAAAPHSASPPPAASASHSGATSAKPDLSSQLRELAKLRDEGILTQEEFSDQKAKLLAN